jgi:site-specific DNA-methyltransferase (adenine-specific)
MSQQIPAPRNRTLRVNASERESFIQSALRNKVPAEGAGIEAWVNRIFLGEMEDIAPLVPPHSVDLLILDPPYNLRRDFGSSTFRQISTDEYAILFSQWIDRIIPSLKPHATIYVCADWKTSAAIFPCLQSRFTLRNRISWEREKGRGSTTNWKSTCEDIWFCTMSEKYCFYPDRVRLRREVIAPYRDANGKPKDWVEDAKGSFRDTAPSNLWTDLTVPFWSMPENTEHPTQKPEKLIAKLILASSDEGDVIFDPFLGSGTSAVVAKKLGRKFVGIEHEPDYAAVSQKRVDIATLGDPIQGYQNGVFWARNTGAAQLKLGSDDGPPASSTKAWDLFDA